MLSHVLKHSQYIEAKVLVKNYDKVMKMDETTNDNFRDRWFSHLKVFKGELDVDVVLNPEDTLTNVSSPSRRVESTH